MIRIESRYVTAPVQYILDDRTGHTRPTVMRGPVPARTPRQIYRWRQGDRIDELGTRFTDKPQNWWQIIDRNPDIIDPLSIAHGQAVVIK